MTTPTNTQTLLRLGTAALIAAGLAGCGRSAPNDAEPVASSSPGQHQSVKLDHPTYGSIGTLVAAADLVVVGKVTGMQQGDSLEMGADATGEPLGALPFVDYLVHVTEVVRGTLAAGADIAITFPGGESSGTLYTVEGVAPLEVGQTLMFFLSKDAGGKYFAMAGGLAIASPAPDSRFLLPGEATGGDALTFTRQNVKSARSQTLSLFGVGRSTIRLKASPSSGGFAIAVGSDGSRMISGVGLVGGRVVELAVKWTGRVANGTVTVDDRAFALVRGLVVKSQGQRVTITGSTPKLGSRWIVRLELR